MYVCMEYVFTLPITQSVFNFTIQESIDEMKQSQTEEKAEMKMELIRTKLQLTGMERKQDQMKVRQDCLMFLLCGFQSRSSITALSIFFQKEMLQDIYCKIYC